ncbi:MAG: dTDP-4-dehydrorhamnose 3,5-epimerase family protein [Nitrososphaeria archaeon]
MLNQVKELSLPGVRLFELTRFPDERGIFTEIFRMDWKNLLGEDSIMQANFSVTYPNVVRAWHRHERGQVDYFLTIKGSIKVCVYDENSSNMVEVILSDARIQVLRVPGHYWHGFKVVSSEAAYLIYFVNRLYDYTQPDEVRRPWNDSTIIPRKINGKSDDPRCNKPWDWFYPVHR